MRFETDQGPIRIPDVPLQNVLAALVASGATTFRGEGIEGVIERSPAGPRITMRLVKKGQVG